ncbi:hypothetical protein [Porphyromonas endodontalis]|jgi:hypothetical protein|uniref:hypothetical protein n=1 Tax=Porphyromonas endodontalis TaxID=28124 RepID=UPI0028F01CC7|nr:hypothetical protein [Porphyromonas endodontalis]
MASRRKLKKGIKEITDFLIDDILFISLDAKEEDLRALELLLNRVVDLHDDTIAKIGAPDGAKNPQLVRKFYADLKAKYNEEIEAVESELEKYISLDK